MAMVEQAATAASIGERLARKPWLISAPWKAWPPHSEAQSHVDWKHRIDTYADKAREQLHHELLTLMGDHLRVNLVVASLCPNGVGRLAMRRIDIVGKAYGLAHAHVIGAQAVMAAHNSRDALSAMAVSPQEVNADICMLDRIEIRDVVDQIHDVGACWPSGDIGWFSACGETAVNHVLLAEHMQALADRTSQGDWHQHYSDFARSFQMRSSMAVLCGSRQILSPYCTQDGKEHELPNGRVHAAD